MITKKYLKEEIKTIIELNAMTEYGRDITASDKLVNKLATFFLKTYEEMEQDKFDPEEQEEKDWLCDKYGNTDIIDTY